MGVAKLKAKLRAWLIDLVREAIRMENAPRDPVEAMRRRMPERPPAPHPMMQPEPIGALLTITPSFEQLQAEAIAAQEKFYEPERA